MRSSSRRGAARRGAPTTPRRGRSTRRRICSAERVYPVLRDHLDGRLPALFRPADVDEDVALASVADAFAEVEADWPALLPVDRRVAGCRASWPATSWRSSSISRASRSTRRTPPRSRASRSGAVHAFASLDPAGARARTVHVRLATFSRYDEYGAGVRDAAEIVRVHELDRDGLVELLGGVRARHPLNRRCPPT